MFTFCYVVWHMQCPYLHLPEARTWYKIKRPLARKTALKGAVFGDWLAVPGIGGGLQSPIRN
jgi:hypothetical protein